MVGGGDGGGVCGSGGALVFLFVGLLVSWFACVTYCFGVIISFVFSF